MNTVSIGSILLDSEFIFIIFQINVISLLLNTEMFEWIHVQLTEWLMNEFYPIEFKFAFN